LPRHCPEKRAFLDLLKQEGVEIMFGKSRHH